MQEHTYSITETTPGAHNTGNGGWIGATTSGPYYTGNGGWIGKTMSGAYYTGNGGWIGATTSGAQRWHATEDEEGQEMPAPFLPDVQQAWDTIHKQERVLVVVKCLDSRRGLLSDGHSTNRCWDPITKHNSNPDVGAMLITLICGGQAVRWLGGAR